MRVVISGATGLIGKALTKNLLDHGYDVIGLTRSRLQAERVLDRRATIAEWDGKTAAGWGEFADGAYGVVNLAGESIVALRWTEAKKQRVFESRVGAVAAVAEAVRAAALKPRVIVQASAIGIYGSRGEEPLDESSARGSGYLADFASRWEEAARVFTALGVRTAWIRTGIVLDAREGALPQMTRPFRFFAGGPLGSGRQYYSWIHIDDEVEAIRFLLENQGIEGPVNLTAPDAMPLKDFCRVLGQVMRRPSWLPAPAFALRLIFGELADEMLLAGQRVSPKKLEAAGFTFRFPTAASALADILRDDRTKKSHAYGVTGTSGSTNKPNRSSVTLRRPLAAIADCCRRGRRKWRTENR